MTNHEIEVPADMAFLSKLMDRAEAGLITYLTHEGHRIATVVPADVVETIQRALAEAHDDPVLSGDESQRRLQLAREQGVEPVTDPAELRGPGMPEEEFRAFHGALVSGRGERER